ncbi:MAG: TetR/AcrR family transcriptional regulator [Chloroflexota bacterium]
MSELTPKAQRTRKRIFDVAIDQFMSKGYDETTMRDIAKAADCSLGLAYRYFDSKEAMVLMLWEELADDFAERITKINTEHDTLTARYHAAMGAKIKQLEPYRAVIQGTIGRAMNPASGVAIVSDETTWYRDVVLAGLEEMVLTASDAPNEDRSKQIAMIMYGVHLILTLVWVYDKTTNQRLTQEALDFMKDGMKLLRPLLILPPVGSIIERLANIMAGVFKAENVV